MYAKTLLLGRSCCEGLPVIQTACERFAAVAHLYSFLIMRTADCIHLATYVLSISSFICSSMQSFLFCC